MNKLFFVLFLFVCLTGCATFSDTYTNGNTVKLNSQNLPRLNGTYRVYASGTYDEKGHYTALSSSKKKYPLYKKIENKFPNLRNKEDLKKVILNTKLDSIPSISNTYDQVDVSVKENYISFSLIKNNKAVKILNYETTLKDGFLYLPKEKNCVKVPSGSKGCIKSQRRIGLTDDGGLIIHEYNDVNSSSEYASFFLSLAEGNGNNVYKYEKIK